MMSEKRFRVMANESKQLYCIESVDGEMFSMQEIVDMLNSLNDENEQLRKDLSDCEKFRYHIFKKIGELADERKRD